MNIKPFIIGIGGAFAIPWVLVIAYPAYKLKNQQAVVFEDENGNPSMYHPKINGRVNTGEKVYQSENCQVCHTQVIRPTTSGIEVHRINGPRLFDPESEETTIASWAGTFVKDKTDKTVADSRRESISQDYLFDTFAPIGERRIGPDLMNVGARYKLRAAAINKLKAEWIEEGKMKPVTPEELLYLHLYNPRYDDAPENGLNTRSTCPSNGHLFDCVTDAGQGARYAIPLNKKCGNYQIVPSANAKALVDYLLTRDKHDKLPAIMDNAPKED